MKKILIIILLFCTTNIKAQIKIYNMDSIFTYPGFVFGNNEVIDTDLQENIICNATLFKPNSNIRKGTLLYKYNNIGNYLFKTYMYDSIQGKESGIFKIKDSLVLFATKDTLGIKKLKAYWLDDSFKIVKEFSFDYPENNTRDLTIISIDSIENNYFLFANNYPQNGSMNANRHSVILKINKIDFSLKSATILDTNQYRGLFTELVYNNKFKLVTEKSNNNNPNYITSVDTNFNTLQSKLAWRTTSSIICNIQNDTIYFKNNTSQAFQNTKPWNDTSYLWGLTTEIYKCNGTGINSSSIRRGAIAKMKHSTDSMQSITILPQLEEEDSLSENRQVPFYNQYDITNRNYIYMAYSGLHNSKARGYIGVSCLDSNLNIRWTRFIVTPEWIFANSVHTISDGVIIAADSNAGFGGNRMPFICKIDSTGFPLSIGSNLNQTLKSYLVYPNPANENIQVVSGNHYESDFCLYNLQGQLVLKENLKAMQSTKIKLPTLLNGIYFYKISSKKGIEDTGKLMIE